MGKIIDEYMDIKLQQECVSKTIDALWKMALKYQKITEIMNELNGDFFGSYLRDRQVLEKIYEVIKDGNNNQHN